MKTLLLLTALIAPNVLAGPYLSLGIGAHPGADRPEIVLDNPIGIVETGYEYDNGIVVKYTHMSGIGTRESGYGLNLISVNYVWRWK